MRVSLRWLREYVDFTESADELAHRLSMSGTEVGTVIRVGAHWDRVTIGRVREIKRHEGADHLFVAQVDIGTETLTLVTAATNLRDGDVVPVIQAGGRLAPDRVLDARRFRGVLSQGMMCSGEELGVSNDKDGIYILEPEAPLGVNLQDYLGDEILDIELTPNRADCLGIVGIAREVAALTGGKLRQPTSVSNPAASGIDEHVHIFVDDPDLCPRYTATYIGGVTVGPSPQWLQRRLHSAGVRSISNVVDVTNYVMIELGQPLHAFDADRIRDNTIRVRRSQAGERLTTIDGEERELPANTLVIADAAIPVGLAGIMGGINSEISDTTTGIVLESATFDRASIRRTSKALRLSSEASKRFDKGIDHELAPVAARRAAALIADLAGGVVASGLIDIQGVLPEQRTIRFTAGDIAGLIGQQYSVVDIERALLPLGFELQVSGDAIAATVPTWRADVEGRADIAEEVARIVGYDEIPVALPSGRLPRAAEDPALRWEDALRTALAAAGLQEVKTYSLVGPSSEQKLDPLGAETGEDPSIAVYNPMSVDQSRLRTTLLPSLLETTSENLRFLDRVQIFEIARVYLPPLDPLPREARRLAIVLAGRRAPEGWGHDPSAVDFYDLKGIVEAACRTLHLPAPAVKASAGVWLHPGRGATVLSEVIELGLMGQVHPRVAERFDIDGVEVYATELDLDALLAMAREEVRVTPLSRYPAVMRDLALIVPEERTHDDITGVIRGSGGSLLEEVRLFDVYRGSQVPEGHRSLAYALTFRSPERTLTEDEIARAMHDVESTLATRFGARIRGR